MPDQPVDATTPGPPEPAEPADARHDGVRRELAAARHDQPLPPDVGARLDRVLAALAAERADPPHPDRGLEEAGDPGPPVTDLAARRRRRRASVLLAAAAAVIVVGVGIGHLRGSSGTSAADSSVAAATQAPTRAPTRASAQASAADPGRAPGSRLNNGVTRSYLDSVIGGVPRLHEQHFSRDVRRVLQRRLVAGTGSVNDQDRLAPSLPPVVPSAPAAVGPLVPTAASCVAPGLRGPGRLIRVRYDGAPAVLALRPLTGQTRVVDLLQCGSGAVLRSISVPATS